MGLFFDDPLFEEFASTLALGLASHGGAELGEVQATSARIADGDDESWFAAWRATADRLVRAGDACAAGGHRVSARESYLRASVYYALAYHPLFGAPPDPRLLDAFGSQRAAFDKAASLLEPAGEALEIALGSEWVASYRDSRCPAVARPWLARSRCSRTNVGARSLGPGRPDGCPHARGASLRRPRHDSRRRQLPGGRRGERLRGRRRAGWRRRVWTWR